MYLYTQSSKEAMETNLPKKEGTKPQGLLRHPPEEVIHVVLDRITIATLI